MSDIMMCPESYFNIHFWANVLFFKKNIPPPPDYCMLQTLAPLWPNAGQAYNTLAQHLATMGLTSVSLLSVNPGEARKPLDP